MPRHTDPAIQMLLDQQAISRVLHRYCQGCDRADEQALRVCFHPDARHRHGSFDGLSSDFIGAAMEIVRPLKVCKHMLSNIMITVDGDEAESECHYLAYHRRVDPDTGVEEDCFSGGRYLDRFERRQGEWRIARRLGLLDLEIYAAPTDRTLWQAPSAQRSAPYPGDPLYSEFARVLDR